MTNDPAIIATDRIVGTAIATSGTPPNDVLCREYKALNTRRNEVLAIIHAAYAERDVAVLKLLDYIENEGPPAKEWRGITDTVKLLRELYGVNNDQ